MTAPAKLTAEQMGQIQENTINALRDALKMSLPIWCSTYGHQAIIDRDLLLSHIDDLNAEIAALKAERQWRPIESAPKDSHSRLVWCPERKNTYAVTWAKIWSDDEGFWQVFGGSRLDETPTHWLPLPKRPP